jgi:hypothetical protein
MAFAVISPPQTNLYLWKCLEITTADIPVKSLDAAVITADKKGTDIIAFYFETSV